MVANVYRWVLFVWVLVAGEALAMVGLDIFLDSRLDGLSGPGWEAQQIDIKLRRGFGGIGSLHLTIGQLNLPAGLPALKGVHLECMNFSLAVDGLRCTDAQVGIRDLQGRPASGQMSFDYSSSDGILDFNITDLTLAGGRVAVRGNVSGDGWSIGLDATALEVSALSALLQPLFAWPLEGGQGRLAIHVSLSGRGTDLDEARLRMTGRGVGFSAASGRYAAQDLGTRVDGHWRSRPQGGEFNTHVRLLTGQLYLDPVFVDIAAQQAGTITAYINGRLNGERLAIERLSLQHDQVLQAEGALQVRLGETPTLEGADITLTEALFPAAYEYYLQPFVVGGVMGDLQTKGRVGGRLSLAQGAVQALELDAIDLHFADLGGRFGASQVNGRLDWGLDAKPRYSTLRWQAGHVYRLEIGPAELAWESKGEQFRLLGRGRIPILDGAVIIDRLEGQGLGSDDLSWQFDGLLTSVSMEILSQTFGWPTLSGKLSGVISDARYADHTLEVGGSLQLRIFAGDITVANLRVERPFGVVPKVFADVDIHDVDLLALTRTFDFGRIEGTLEGQIRRLRLEDWEPVYFEARFASPKERRGRRRISQRAVQNLSALGGGGASAALSRGFLSLFEEFSYKRLGISCRLANGICEMDGVAPARQGYYLVEGEGVPRIDVIGHNRLVDWQVLLARLKAAIRSEGPVVR